MNNRLPILVLLVAIIIPLAAAGTLKGGGIVEVNQNYPEFGQYNIVGTWSNTPTFNDRLVISGANLPSDWEATDRVEVVFQEPLYEEVFIVREQERLNQVQYNTRQFFYTPSFDRSVQRQRCLADAQNYRETTLAGAPLLEGTTYVGTAVGIGSCTVHFVTVDSQRGWIGNAFKDRINFRQQINVGSQGSVVLERTQNRDQLTDSIPGLAQFGLDSFSQYTNTDLTEDGVYGYHTTTAGEPAGNWKAFSDSSGWIGTYKDGRNTLQRVFSRTNPTLITDYGVDTGEYSAAQNAVTSMNDAASRIPGLATGVPSGWTNRVTDVRSESNLIIAEPSKDNLVADINFVINADTIGLVRPQGECEITSVSDTACFVETQEGRVPYSIRNVGAGADSFSVSATCNNGDVTALPNDHQLGAGQSVSDDLFISAKSTTTDTQAVVGCTITCRANSAEQTVTSGFDACVDTKENCVEGEETAPSLTSSGDEYVVEVLTSTCAVKEVKRCSTDGNRFEKNNDGRWECVAVASGEPTTPDAGDEGDFSVGIFVFALVIGTVFAGFTAYFLSPLKKLFSGGNVVRWVLIVAAFLAGVIGTALAVQSVVSLFSFGSLSGGLFG